MVAQDRPYDVVVIGAGPAGLTAAIYSGRALRSTLLIEKALPGGQLNETDVIENWPGIEETTPAPQLMKQLRSQAERFGAEILLDEVTGIEVGEDVHRVVAGQATIEARTIILACGSRPRELPAKNADRLKGKGLSYCATCDGFFYQGKHIIEVGAGDSGLTEALFLTRFAESISIVVRHPENDPKAFRASGILIQRAREHPKIDFLWDRVVEELLGEDHLMGVRLRVLSSDTTEDVPIDGVFVNIGHLPQTHFLRDAIALDDEGYILTDTRLRTNVEGIYAAGDARIDAHRYAQGVIAAGEGAIAAIEAETYLSER